MDADTQIKTKRTFLMFSIGFRGGPLDHKEKKFVADENRQPPSSYNPNQDEALKWKGEKGIYRLLPGTKVMYWRAK